VRRAARVYLLVVSILNGLAGLICGVLFIASPDGSLMGFQPLVPVVQALPLGDIFFRDLWWIGVAMLLMLAVPNLVATFMLLRRSAHQYRVTLAAAVLLMLWCGFEILFMFNVAAVGYFLVGAASAFCSGVLLRIPARASA
jgi:hypothetical protein